MAHYYTENPESKFQAMTDEDALRLTKAKFVYKESDTPDGTPFIILRDEE